MESQTTDTGRVEPGREFPASRPGIRFALCVAAVVVGFLGYIVFY